MSRTSGRNARPNGIPQFVRKLWVALVLAHLATAAVAADEATIISNPAEKYAIAPGGVDMRTGQYVYSETDLQIGPATGGLALTRTTPVYVAGHTNPFGNFSDNWDIMLVERRVRFSPPFESGQDYRMFFHFGGRTFTFESQETAPGYGYKSDGAAALLTFTGGAKDSATVVYTVRGPDGTLYKFRPMGGQDCTNSRRCAFVDQITEPDGTVYHFTYAYDATASGNRARLTRVTSSRGYVLMLEGTIGKVARACVINTADIAPPSGITCPGTALSTTTYTYTIDNKLSGATAANGQVSQFTYAPASGGEPGTEMGFIKPGFSTPWLTNRITMHNDEDEVPHEITNEQHFADGRTYTYGYGYSPYTINKTVQSIAGGAVTDGLGHQIVYQYDWPILPESRERICRSLPCSLPMPDDEYRYIYQQTTGPILIIDELGRETRFDYCDPPVWSGLPPQSIDRCTLVKNYNYFLPEKGTGPVSGDRPDTASGRVEFDGNGNVAKVTKYPKPGSNLAPIETTAIFEGGAFTQTKPRWVKDANGNQTDYTYDPSHGGVLTETGPAVNGVRPQKRYSYVQRYAWISNGSGGYVQAASPVWLLASESSCRTSAWTGSACAAGATDEVVTAYDYGPNSGPNNLLLRGTAITADGVTRRSCYGYDSLGRKISETSPNANLTVCP